MAERGPLLACWRASDAAPVTAMDVDGEVIVTAGADSVISVSAQRLSIPGHLADKESSAIDADSWIVASNIPLTADSHGASVVSRADGKVIGQLIVDENGSQVSLMPPRPILK